MSEFEESTETGQAPIPPLDMRMDNASSQADDLDVDTGTGGVEVLATHNSSDDVQSDCRVSKQQIKPVIRLSYDLPGQPSNKPVVVVHRGVRISITPESNGTDISCFTVYLNPVAPGQGCIELKLNE